MSEKSGNHIWPAYVDMMTVLLMVYLLLALLFQVVVATSKTAVSQSSQAQQRKEAQAKQVTEQKQTSEETPKGTRVSSPNANSEAPNLVELNPIELKLNDGDFSLIITETKRNFLSPAEINLTKSWIEENRAKITDKGVRVFSVAQVNRQIGAVLKIQFDRALSVISVLLSAGIPQDKIVFDNVVVRDVEKDYVALRLQ